MVEMTTLVAAIYRKYRTITSGDYEIVSPAVTARYEVFYDEKCYKMRVCLLALDSSGMLTHSGNRSMNAISPS